MKGHAHEEQEDIETFLQVRLFLSPLHAFLFTTAFVADPPTRLPLKITEMGNTRD